MGYKENTKRVSPSVFRPKEEPKKKKDKKDAKTKPAREKKK